MQAVPSTTGTVSLARSLADDLVAVAGVGRADGWAHCTVFAARSEEALLHAAEECYTPLYPHISAAAALATALPVTALPTGEKKKNMSTTEVGAAGRDKKSKRDKKDKKEKKEKTTPPPPAPPQPSAAAEVAAMAIVDGPPPLPVALPSVHVCGACAPLYEGQDGGFSGHAHAPFLFADPHDTPHWTVPHRNGQTTPTRAMHHHHYHHHHHAMLEGGGVGGGVGGGSGGGLVQSRAVSCVVRARTDSLVQLVDAAGGHGQLLVVGAGASGTVRVGALLGPPPPSSKRGSQSRSKKITAGQQAQRERSKRAAATATPQRAEYFTEGEVGEVGDGEACVCPAGAASPLPWWGDGQWSAALVEAYHAAARMGFPSQAKKDAQINRNHDDTDNSKKKSSSSSSSSAKKHTTTGSATATAVMRVVVKVRPPLVAVKVVTLPVQDLRRLRMSLFEGSILKQLTVSLVAAPAAGAAAAIAAASHKQHQHHRAYDADDNDIDDDALVCGGGGQCVRWCPGAAALAATDPAFTLPYDLPVATPTAANNTSSNGAASTVHSISHFNSSGGAATAPTTSMMHGGLGVHLLDLMTMAAHDGVDDTHSNNNKQQKQQNHYSPSPLRRPQGGRPHGNLVACVAVVPHAGIDEGLLAQHLAVAEREASIAAATNNNNAAVASAAASTAAAGVGGPTSEATNGRRRSSVSGAAAAGVIHHHHLNHSHHTPPVTTPTATPPSAAAPSPPPPMSDAQRQAMLADHRLALCPHRAAYILEYCDGGTLEGLVGARTAAGSAPLTTAHAGALLFALLLAVDHLHHAFGLIHRDIKPANILLCREDSGLNRRGVFVGSEGTEGAEGGGEETLCIPSNTTMSMMRCSDRELWRLKLADYGIAKAAVDARTACGTRSYMAPEVRNCMILARLAAGRVLATGSGAGATTTSSSSASAGAAARRITFEEIDTDGEGPQQQNSSHNGNGATTTIATGTRSTVGTVASDSSTSVSSSSVSLWAGAAKAPRFTGTASAYGQAADVYSLGVVLQFILAGGSRGPPQPQQQPSSSSTAADASSSSKHSAIASPSTSSSPLGALWVFPFSPSHKHNTTTAATTTAAVAPVALPPSRSAAAAAAGRVAQHQHQHQHQHHAPLPTHAAVWEVPLSICCTCRDWSEMTKREAGEDPDNHDGRGSRRSTTTASAKEDDDEAMRFEADFGPGPAHNEHHHHHDEQDQQYLRRLVEAQASYFRHHRAALAEEDPSLAAVSATLRRHLRAVEEEEADAPGEKKIEKGDRAPSATTTSNTAQEAWLRQHFSSQLAAGKKNRTTHTTTAAAADAVVCCARCAKITPAVVRLVNAMTHVDPLRRPTLQQLFLHPIILRFGLLVPVAGPASQLAWERQHYGPSSAALADHFITTPSSCTVKDAYNKSDECESASSPSSVVALATAPMPPPPQPLWYSSAQSGPATARRRTLAGRFPGFVFMPSSLRFLHRLLPRNAHSTPEIYKALTQTQ